MKIDKADIVAQAHRLARDYRALIEELKDAADTLEKAGMHAHDSYPVVSASRLTRAMKRGMLLTYFVDEDNKEDTQ